MKINGFKSILFFIVTLSLLSFAFPLFAQNSELQVKCLDASQNPAQNVKVTLINVQNKKPKDKKSDNQGIAVFDKLDNGVYRVVGRKEGFAASFFEYVLVNGTKEAITLKLAAGEDKPLYFENPALEQSAVGFLRQGLDAFQQGNVADSEKFFKQSVDINPSAADALYYYGLVLLRQSKFELGAEALNKAASVANIMKTLPSTGQAGKQNPYEIIAGNVPQQLAQIPMYKADDAFKQQKYDEAAALYAEAIKANPNMADLYANRARALTQAKRNEEAIVSVNKAIELKPDEKAYASLKATISARIENDGIKKAQTIMDEGNKMLSAEDAAGALKKFEEANALIPQEKQSPVWRQIGQSLAKLNRQEEAIAAFKKSIALAPADKTSDYQMAFAQFYLDIKKFEEAVDVMADSKTAGSKSPEQILLDLVARVKMQEPKLAELALERIIKLNPANMDACYDLGRLYYMDKANDKRTKELLTKFSETGTDPDKLEDVKGMLLIINRRNK
jgi:tetratricopeptide (TPR) repeat protein